MNRLAELPRPRPGQLDTERRPQERRVQTPPHLAEVLTVIRTRFAVAKNAEPLDADDTLAYTTVLVKARLTPVQCRQLVQCLRERHVYRPSVAEVKAAVDTVTRADAETIESCDAQARTVVHRPLALPPHPDNPGRLEFRAALRRMKAGQRPGPDLGKGGAA